tara:strand:- start:1957 stop:2127 length:171 start_codon:yes stop_codon:yes gene_type:complete
MKTSQIVKRGIKFSTRHTDIDDILKWHNILNFSLETASLPYPEVYPLAIEVINNQT